jgi:SAM-dependent methyltransferase
MRRSPRLADARANRQPQITRMAKDWERRARADPLFAIDATRPGRDVERFYARGPRLVDAVVDPALRHLGVDPAGRRVLDIGCGMGRLFAGLAARFGEVWGIDISPAMIEQGRAHCPVQATWLVGDGASLSAVADESIDHVISYEVFQHVPDRAVIASYQQEIERVLKPGGTFQVQLRSGSDSTRQEIVRRLPRPLRRAAGVVLRVAGVLRVGGDVDTWLGCVVTPADAVAGAAALGLREVAVLPDTLHPPGMGYWLVGRKGPQGPGLGSHGQPLEAGEPPQYRQK